MSVISKEEECSFEAIGKNTFNSHFVLQKITAIITGEDVLKLNTKQNTMRGCEDETIT